jgi:hypothetical protein
MVQMGTECLSCGKPKSPDPAVKHYCKDTPTFGNAHERAAQIQLDDPKEEYENIEFSKAVPRPTPSPLHVVQQPSPDTPGHAGSMHPQMKISRVVTDIQLPCETCGDYVVFKPVPHDCKEKG